MAIKKYHRKWENWDYRAVSTTFDGKEIVYGVSKSDGKKSEGVEVYSGKNYDVDSTARSHSNRYDMNEVPKSYKKIVAMLKKAHHKIKWSKNKEVNLN